MPTAYIVEPGSVVRSRGRTLHVMRDGKHLAKWELTHLDSLTLVGRVNVTMPCLTLLLRCGIPCVFVTTDGRFRGRLTPPKSGKVQLRAAQYALFADPSARTAAARKIVKGKLLAMQAILEHYASHETDPLIGETSLALQSLMERLPGASSVPTLLGLEGAAASKYFGALRHLNRGNLPFGTRSTRPPRDPVNSMLSFGYSLLAAEIHALLETAGLDPWLGYYHGLAPHRPSLVLDVMEPFRHLVIDWAVIRAVNLGRFSGGDFVSMGNGGVRLSHAAIKRFIAVFEQAMLDPPKRWPKVLRLAEFSTGRETLARYIQSVADGFQKRWNESQIRVASVESLDDRRAA